MGCQYNDLWYETRDGLQLYARDYAPRRALDKTALQNDDSQRPTVLCIHGLTRNSADFSELSEQLSEYYRVLSLDLRGRGRSDYDPNPLNYHPGTYADDVAALLAQLDLRSVVLVGTSLGGLVSMLLMTLCPQRIAGIVMNDIGPEINRDGLARIRDYVCEPIAVTNWQEAIAAVRQINQREYPDFSDADWRAFTRNLYRENERGNPVLNYDPNISLLMQQNPPEQNNADLWPVFDAVKSTPLLVVRGALSDILTRECVEKMRAQHPAFESCEVANCGHAPLLIEQTVVNHIERFLASRFHCEPPASNC